MRHAQLDWYIAGPALGLCVVAVRALFSARLGVTGGYSELIGKLRHGSVSFDWRGWFAIGLFVAGTIFALLAGTQTFDGYGWLTETFTGSERVLIAPILVAAGVAIGYGAKLSGGCTSGNGLSGVSVLSPAALASTATFFVVAIAVSFVIKALI